jgi:hypothetical protein
MKTRTFMVAESLEDLRGVTPGTRIVTNDNKLLLSEMFGGRIQWYEDGQLENWQPTSEWLPAIIINSQEVGRRNQ